MLNYHLTIGSPWLLAALLPLVPVCWWLSWPSRGVIGRARWVLINALLSVVLLLLMLALADVQAVRVNDRLTVIYLLDQSLSIPPDQRRAMVDYVNAAIQEQLPLPDRVGVIDRKS